MGKHNLNRAGISPIVEDPDKDEYAYEIWIRDSNFDNKGQIKVSPLLYDVFHEFRHGIYAIAKRTSSAEEEADAQIYAVRDVEDFYKNKPGFLDDEDYHFIMDSNLGNPKERAEAEAEAPDVIYDNQFYISHKVKKMNR